MEDRYFELPGAAVQIPRKRVRTALRPLWHVGCDLVMLKFLWILGLTCAKIVIDSIAFRAQLTS